jgi:hypothetical protein
MGEPATFVYIRALQRHWRAVEESKLGHSPTGEITILTAGQLLDAAQELVRLSLSRQGV